MHWLHLNFTINITEAIKSHSGGWSLRAPQAVKSILWEIISLNRLAIFLVLILIFIFTHFIEIKFFEKQIVALKKICSRKLFFKFSKIAEE